MKRKDLVLIVPREYNQQFSSNSKKIHRMNKSITENVINSPYEDINEIINGVKASNEHLKKLSLLPVISKENLFTDNLNKITYERKRTIEDNKNRNKYKIKKNPLSIQYLSLKENLSPFDKYLKSILNKGKPEKRYKDIKNDKLLLSSNIRKKILKKYLDKTYEKEKNDFKKYFNENKDDLSNLLENEIIKKATQLNSSNKGIFRNPTELSLETHVIDSFDNDMIDCFNNVNRDNYNENNKLYANDRKNCSNEKKKISKYIKENENIKNFIIHNIFFEWVIDNVVTKINDNKLKNYLYDKSASKSAKKNFKQLLNKEISDLSNSLFRNKLNLYHSYDSLINSLRPISDYVIKLKNKSKQIINNNKKIKSADLAKSSIIDKNSLDNYSSSNGKEERIIKSNILNKLIKKIIDVNNIKSSNSKNFFDEKELSKSKNIKSNSNSYESNDNKIYYLKNKNRVKSSIDSPTSKVSFESKNSNENKNCINLRRNLNTIELPMINRSRNEEYFDNLMDKFYSRNFKNYFNKKRINNENRFSTEEKEDNLLRKNLEPKFIMKKNNTECILDYNSNINTNNNYEFNKINDIQNIRNKLNLSNNNNESLKLQQKLNVRYLNKEIIFKKEKPLLNKHLINPKFLFNKIESYNNLDTNEDKNNELSEKNLRYNIFNKFINNNKIHNNIALIPKKNNIENRGKTINTEKLPKIYKLFERHKEKSKKEISSSNINNNNADSNNNINSNNIVNNNNQTIKSNNIEKNKDNNKTLLKNNSSNENEINNNESERKVKENNNTDIIKNETNQKIKEDNMNKDFKKGKDENKVNSIRINKSYEKKEKTNYFNINKNKRLNNSNEEIINDENKKDKDKEISAIINSKKENKNNNLLDKNKNKENDRNIENIEKEKAIKGKEEIKNNIKKDEINLDKKNNKLQKENNEKKEIKNAKVENKGKNKAQEKKVEKIIKKEENEKIIKNNKAKEKIMEENEKNIKKDQTIEKTIEEKEISKNIKSNTNAHNQSKKSKVNNKEKLKNNINDMNERKVNINKKSFKDKKDLKNEDEFKTNNENIKNKNTSLSKESKDSKENKKIKSNNINLAQTEKEKEKSPIINAKSIESKDEIKNMKKILGNLFNRYIPNKKNEKIENGDENENENEYSFIENEDIEKLIYYNEQIHNLKNIQEKSEENSKQQQDLKEKFKEIIMKYVIKLINENKEENNENGNEINGINTRSEEIMKLIFNNSDINQPEEEGEGEGEGEGEKEEELDEVKDEWENEVENNSKNENENEEEKEDDKLISDTRRRKRKVRIRVNHLSIIDKIKQQDEQVDTKDKSENKIEIVIPQRQIISEEKLKKFFKNVKKLKNNIKNENIVQKIMGELFDENIEVERNQKRKRILNFIEDIQNRNNHDILKPKVNFLSPIKFSIHNISKNSIK